MMSAWAKVRYGCFCYNRPTVLSSFCLIIVVVADAAWWCYCRSWCCAKAFSLHLHLVSTFVIQSRQNFCGIVCKLPNILVVRLSLLLRYTGV